MAPKRKPVSEAGHVGENGNGFRARIKINGTWTNGRTYPTRELAQANLNAARAGATSHGDVAVALKKHLSSSSLVPSAAVLPEHAPEHPAGAGAAAHEDIAATLTKEPSSSSVAPRAVVQSKLAAGMAAVLPEFEQQRKRPASGGGALQPTVNSVAPKRVANDNVAALLHAARSKRAAADDRPQTQKCPRMQMEVQRRPSANRMQASVAPRKCNAGRPRTKDDELILLIRQPWLELILSGEKTWEVRSMPTNIRHRILLAEPGTGMCSGQAIIDDVIKIQRADFASYANLHQVRSPEGYAIIDKYVSIYAWQLRDVTRLSVQRPFKHPLGAITWVRLRASEANTAEVSEANGAAEASRPNPLTIRTCNSAEGCGRCFCETCYPLG